MRYRIGHCGAWKRIGLLDCGLLLVVTSCYFDLLLVGHSKKELLYLLLECNKPFKKIYLFKKFPIFNPAPL